MRTDAICPTQTSALGLSNSKDGKGKGENWLEGEEKRAELTSEITRRSSAVLDRKVRSLVVWNSNSAIVTNSS